MDIDHSLGIIVMDETYFLYFEKGKGKESNWPASMAILTNFLVSARKKSVSWLRETAKNKPSQKC